MKSICIIVPVYNEEENIQPLYATIRAYMQTLNLSSWTLLYIDDGSTDGTCARIRALAQHDIRVQAISFSRHFGHQPALMAGIQAAEADWLVTMDGDLQHPPELIGAMMQRMEEGYDIVHVQRISRESNLKSWLSKCFYTCYNYLSETPITPDAADFKMFNRQVKQALVQFQENALFVRGLMHWVGFKSTVITYEKSPRNAGKTKYPLHKQVQLAWDALISFSFRPLRLVFFLGFLIGSLAFLFAIIAILSYWFGKTIPGWTSLLLCILFLGSLQLIAIGLLGEYLGKVYEETKKRPLYLIRETINR
ncbi:MAG: glycosyltransferase [Thermoflavifilum sp.]|uniref:glycosyltransferase family 2 protein n=1 Tax=Thermoflavifilum sp. TaxID=1968839 RepID=UPI0018A342A5|nr:glycosyltransferase family 2 protein [Thermoflavifilum sp.]QOR76314.1 MAG: glycosyltransferase [Thermoflavifilum sp.]